LKRELTELAGTITGIGIKEAPVVVVVAVDPKTDPYHYVEDGAAATQNILLAAHSLGLGAFWVGTFNLAREKGSSEERIKEFLRQKDNFYPISEFISTSSPKAH